MRYQSKSFTGLIQLVSLIFIFYNVVINAQFLNNSGLSSLAREYIILDSSKLPSNPSTFLGDTSYFPWDKRNQWQYYWEHVNGPPGHPIIYKNKFVSEQIINGKEYHSYSYFPGSSQLIHYDPRTQKVYISGGQVALDFVAEDSSIQNIYCLFERGMTNYLIEYETFTGWGNTFTEQTYSAVYDYGFAKGIGYTFFHEPYGWPWPYIVVYVNQAIIYDSVGVTLYFDPSKKPVIDYNPPYILDTSYFNIPVEVTHPYSSITPYSSFNFIDHIELQGFYVGPTLDTIMPVSHPIYYEPGSFTCYLKFNVNDSLMRKGYLFKYRIKAVDAAIIPQSAIRPAGGVYFTARYPPHGIKSEEKKVINFHLSQNYPNPFNSETLISFSVPYNGYSSQTSKVSLKVFDLLGSVKEILYNGEMATGDHQIRFTAENLPSGIYFYELNINGRREIKKMILQK